MTTGEEEPVAAVDQGAPEGRIDCNSRLAAFRDEYETRLRTFTVPTYFGKPHSLCPLICARLGYERNKHNVYLIDL